MHESRKLKRSPGRTIQSSQIRDRCIQLVDEGFADVMIEALEKYAMDHFIGADPNDSEALKIARLEFDLVSKVRSFFSKHVM